MSLTTIANAITNISSSARLQTVPYYRSSLNIVQAALPSSLFQINAFPAYPTWNSTGVYPAVSKTATILSQSTTSGSLVFQPAASGSVQYLIGASFVAQQAVGATGWLIDRIVHCQLNLSETNGNFTGFSAVDRLEATGTIGSGAQIWCEVSDPFSNTVSQFYFTYTNQDGSGSRQTPLITTRASGTAGSTIMPTSGVFIPLQNPDVGVRSIESITFVSGSSIATGRYAVALVKPIALFHAYGVITAVEDFNFLQEIVCPEKIHDDAYLQFIVWISGTTTLAVNGQLRLYSE